MPLARILRYGNVRKTDRNLIHDVVDGLFTRICVGLPTTCTAIDDAAAEAMFNRLTAIKGVVLTLQKDEHHQLWEAALVKIMDHHNIHPLLSGRACRLLMDLKVFRPEDAILRLERVLSFPTLSTRNEDHLISAAFWLEGFLRTSGMIILHDQVLWQMLDDWVNQLTPEQFLYVLPLLRRIFAEFSEAARKMLLDRVRHEGLNYLPADGPIVEFDQERADAVIPLVARLFGIEE
jgi:hypothetical protein